MQLILHNYWRSSASYRVRIALALKQLPYTYRAVHLLRNGGEQLQADYHAINPMGQVPTLEVFEADGAHHWLTQSLPIIEYLDERVPTIPLLPRDLVPRAHCRALAEIVNAGIQPLQNLSTTNYVKRLGGDDAAWIREFMTHGLAAFAAACAPYAGTYCMGETPTLADLALAPQLYSATRFGIELTPWPALERLAATYANHPAFVAAHPDQQPDANLP